jgi:polyisoprenoid-binding protein YceI
MTSTAVRPSIAAGTYLIDAARTTVRFAIREAFGLTTCRGTFTVRDGTVKVADDPADSSARVTIDAASFKTDRAKRDAHVKSADFLEVDRYPEIHFASTRTSYGPEGWHLHGVLTAHGRSAPVTLRLLDGAQTAAGCRFTATAVVDRTTYGVTRAVGFIKRDLTIEIEVHATRS